MISHVSNTQTNGFTIWKFKNTGRTYIILTTTKIKKMITYNYYFVQYNNI